VGGHRARSLGSRAITNAQSGDIKVVVVVVNAATANRLHCATYYSLLTIHCTALQNFNFILSYLLSAVMQI